jgi:hypothetical protein
MTSPDFTEQPGLRGFRVPHDGLRRGVQHVRRLVDGQAAKESQFDNLAHTRIGERRADLAGIETLHQQDIAATLSRDPVALNSGQMTRFVSLQAS